MRKPTLPVQSKLSEEARKNRAPLKPWLEGCAPEGNMHKDFCLTQFNPPGPCICEKKLKPYFVTMRDDETWEEVTFSMREIDWGDGSDFWWSEGNYSCDCNRHLEFQEAKTGVRPMDDKVSCNGERYRVIAIKLEDGTQVYGPEVRDSSEKTSEGK